MPFKGEVLDIGELIARAQAAPKHEWTPLSSDPADIRRDAADAAAIARSVHDDGGTPNDGWRFGVLQALDWYNHYAERGGVELGRHVFDREPERTGWPA